MTHGPVAFFSRTYDDAFDLLLDARDYLSDGLARDRGGLGLAEPGAADGIGRLALSRELHRLTSRITSVMAWCLEQKAVARGEISAAHYARQKNRLAGHRVNLVRPRDPGGAIPPRLGHLLERSYRLYLRAHRLDQMIYARAPDAQAARRG